METKRLLIRRFTPGDWCDLYEYLSQEAVVFYEPYGVFTEEESMREAERRSDDDDFWAVCLIENNKLIGNIYLSKRERETWELGYVFNADFHGRGYATEAARAVVGAAFKNHGARNVIAKCNPLNRPSWRLLERLGMRREGHYIKNVWFKKDENGRPIWHDTYEYRVSAEEWN